jgi:hypothetical protein
MLLIEPPLPKCEWALRELQHSRFEPILAQYQAAYEAAVLNLPREQLGKIVAYLVRDLEGGEFQPWLLHEIVQRELLETEFEPSSKVARLIVLCALADMLIEYGHTLALPTRELLDRCIELIPVCLTLAVDDHFGFLPLSS